jgi:uncharacterized protein YndB with AHSA1/START domain
MEQRRLTLRRTLNAPVAEVFAAFLSANALESWWAPAGYEVIRAEVDARVGGHYRLVMRPLDGSPSVSIHGVFREIDPPARLVFTHTFEEGSGDLFAIAGLTDHHTLVTVELRADRDGTELVLVQEQIPSTAAEGVLRPGWESILTRLAAYVACADSEVAG